jgi:uncharacterized membrane protein SpoIIM required for sporulation
MVSGAVIVSSQSTSVRAANLVASFIIVPMALLLQAEAGLLLYANYSALWLIVLALFIVNLILVRMGIRIFNREQLLGRDLDKLDLKKGLQVFWEAVFPTRGLLTLYREEIPSILHNIRAELAITAGVMLIGGIVLGSWGMTNLPLPAGVFNMESAVDPDVVRSMAGQTGLLQEFTVLSVFWHNVRSLLLSAMFSLLSLGILAVLLLMAPIVVIVYLVFQVGKAGINPLGFLGVGVLPHGVLEIPAALIATAQAMRMGDIILSPPDEGGGIFGIIRQSGLFIKLLIAVVLPLLLIASWIEVNLTPVLFANFLAGNF